MIDCCNSWDKARSILNNHRIVCPVPRLLGLSPTGAPRWSLFLLQWSNCSSPQYKCRWVYEEEDTVVVLTVLCGVVVVLITITHIDTTTQYPQSCPGLQCRLDRRREREMAPAGRASPPVRPPLGGRGLALQGQVSVLGEGASWLVGPSEGDVSYGHQDIQIWYLIVRVVRGGGVMVIRGQTGCSITQRKERFQCSSDHRITSASRIQRAWLAWPGLAWADEIRFGFKM